MWFNIDFKLLPLGLNIQFSLNEFKWSGNPIFQSVKKTHFSKVINLND